MWEAIVAEIIGSAVGGTFDLVGGHLNRKSTEKMHREAQGMAERQFSWGQKLDRFNMDMSRQAQTHKITQDRVDRLNEMLRTNIGLQNHVRSLWGGK